MMSTGQLARSVVFRFLWTAVLAAFAFSLPSSLAFAQNEQEEAGPRARQEWFYHQRAYPLQHTPPGVRMRALNQKLAMQQREAAAAQQAGVNINNSSWTLIGPEPITYGFFGSSLTSGRVTAIAVDTSDATGNTLYIGGAEGGVWKTTNGGTNWTPLTDNQFSLAIGSLAIDPNNNQNVYAGTGEENFNGDAYYGGGLLKSANGGTSWTQVGASYFGGPLASEFGGSYIGAIAIQPGAGASTPVLLVASHLSSSSQNFNSGIWRSTDGGNTWTRVLPTTNDQVSYSNAVFFLSNTVAYAAIGRIYGDTNNGVYRSTDAGQTWTAVNGSGSTAIPSGTSTGRMALVAAPSSPSTLYAAIANPSTSGLAGMFKSTDGGATWNAIATPLGTGGNGSTNDFCGSQCWYDMAMAVSPTNPSLLYVGGSFNYGAGNGGIYMSTNAGGNWSSVNPGTLSSETLHPDFHAIAFAAGGSKLYVGNDGGMWSTTQVGTTTLAWNNLNATLAITQFYPGLSISIGSANLALDGTQDNGTLLFLGSLSWQVVTCGDGAWTAIDPTNSNTMWSGCTPQNAYVLRSTNGGTTWNSASSGISTGDPVAFIPPLVMDLNNPNTLYFGTNRVWQTTNGASPFWTAISNDLTNGSPFGDYITAIAVSPVSSTNLFVGTSNNLVWYTTNTGTNWTQITSGFPPRYPTMVQGDPQDGTTFYGTFSGFSGFGDSLGHVFKCSTTTASCSDISSTLPNTPANDIVIDPAVTNTLYLATDIGVLKTTNGGVSWSTFSNGLPNVVVVGLKLHAASRTLRAVTHGRSAWDISLSNTQTLQTLTVTLAGTGTGAVSSTPAGIDCPSTCTTGFNTGTVVSLTPTAAIGSAFAGWSGACPGTGACSVTMSAAQAVTATFAAGGPILTTTAATLISNSGATLNGLANANGTATNVWFEWGTSSNLASFNQCSNLPISGTGTHYVWCALTGLLSPGTKYYYRIAASNSAGTVRGSILNFTAQAQDMSGALQFIPAAPCRVADTRNANGAFGGPAIGGGTSRDFVIPDSACGIPSTAAAYSLNVTVVPHGGLGYLTVWPSGQSQPLVSTLNSIDGRIKANAAIVPAGTSGAISVFATDTTDVVLDINGYFVPGPDPSALAFYPLTPCRIADTRLPNAPLGGPYLVGGQSRAFPIPSSTCQIPSSAQAYSLNFTAVPRGGTLGWLSAWPTGQTWPGVSTLNSLTGTVTANAAIVPAGSNGAINVLSNNGNDTDVVIDINGYFAPAASAPGGLSLYALTPCRVLDTRNTTGSFNGMLPVDVKDSPCGVLPSAQAFALNATVVPAGFLGYLTLWPNGQTQPLVSTLNALDGMITSNMAIVPTANGSINAFSTDSTQLVLDINGYFAP